MKRAIHERSASANNMSLKAQERKIRKSRGQKEAVCRARKDNGHSRDFASQLLIDVEHGKFPGIIAVELSHFSKNPEVNAALQKHYAQFGVSPKGKMIISFSDLKGLEADIIARIMHSGKKMSRLDDLLHINEPN